MERKRFLRPEVKELVLQLQNKHLMEIPELALSSLYQAWEAGWPHSSGSLSRLTDRLTNVGRKFC